LYSTMVEIRGAVLEHIGSPRAVEQTREWFDYQ
jgi:hypothetical protein